MYITPRGDPTKNGRKLKVTNDKYPWEIVYLERYKVLFKTLGTVDTYFSVHSGQKHDNGGEVHLWEDKNLENNFWYLIPLIKEK